MCHFLMDNNYKRCSISLVAHLYISQFFEILSTPINTLIHMNKPVTEPLLPLFFGYFTAHFLKPCNYVLLCHQLPPFQLHFDEWKVLEIGLTIFSDIFCDSKYYSTLCNRQVTQFAFTRKWGSPFLYSNYMLRSYCIMHLWPAQYMFRGVFLSSVAEQQSNGNICIPCALTIAGTINTT